MARLSLYLPPFAGDYAGACSTLFGLDCLIVIVDAGCCTRNYVEYDETRWARRRKSAFSAQLRTLDAVLGDDSRIIAETLEAARELHPAAIALVGTPVPAIVGMDLAGMAYEIEQVSGVPSLGLATSGFETYEQGASLALEALCRRFAVGERSADSLRGGRETACERPVVNVLGMTPHDFASEANMEAVERCLEKAGLEIGFSTARSFSLDDVERAGWADASIVVAWSGVAAAQLLQDRCGVPYLAACPFGDDDCQAIAREVRGEHFRPLWAVIGDGANGPSAAEGESASCNPPVLLVGDQVVMNSLRPHVRARLSWAGIERPVVVGTFFSSERTWAESGDMSFDDECALMAFAESHPGLAVVADPLFTQIPALRDAVFLELPHEAVSGPLFAERLLRYTESETIEALDVFVKRLGR
ncbi:MAG: nitrogenase component 1 [Gordonibacter sp.]|uniref:nitrogenase component 1 n=1 Tax=Gordonibacter sp. TaxID=1968902 RepID=UPI003220894F